MKTMLKDIVSAKVLDGFRLFLRFEDGTEGTVDVARLVTFSGVFQPLSDPAYFAKVTVNPELGTIIWPNGADIDPDVLYAAASGSILSALDNPALVGKNR